MTTTITIKHDGPDHHNVKVIRSYGDPANAAHNQTRVIKAGQSFTHSVYDGVRIECTETSDPPSEP